MLEALIDSLKDGLSIFTSHFIYAMLYPFNLSS
jgi:hypothetical protein